MLCGDNFCQLMGSETVLGSEPMKLPGKTRATIKADARSDMWKDVWIYLTAHGGGPIRSKEVAHAVGWEVRALVAWVRMRSDLFRTEYRNATGEGKASATYILIAPKAIKEPAPIPPEHRSTLPHSTTGALLGSDDSIKIAGKVA